MPRGTIEAMTLPFRPTNRAGRARRSIGAGTRIRGLAVRSVAVAAIWVLAVAACNATPAATPFRPTILAFQGTTCEELAAEFGAIGDPSLRSVVDGPDQIADERMSVLVRRMQDLLVVAVTEQAREVGVIADCTMPEWLQAAERGFSNELRQTIGAAAYDGNPVIAYPAWLLELNDQLVAHGMGKG
jgi:hypothetical protein